MKTLLSLSKERCAPDCSRSSSGLMRFSLARASGSRQEFSVRNSGHLRILNVPAESQCSLCASALFGGDLFYYTSGVASLPFTRVSLVAGYTQTCQLKTSPFCTLQSSFHAMNRDPFVKGIFSQNLNLAVKYRS